MKSTVKNLIFDLGVVLLDLEPSRCFENFRNLGVTNIDKLVDANYKYGLFLDLESGKVSPEEFRAELRKITELQLTDDQIDTAWNTFLLTVPAYKLDFLLDLRKDYNIYLLSNTNAIHWQSIVKDNFGYKGLGLDNFFRKIYLSFELHLVKPDPKIFEYVLADSGIRPEETFFIDDAEENCRIAEAMGIETYMPKAREDWRFIFDK